MTDKILNSDERKAEVEERVKLCEPLMRPLHDVLVLRRSQLFNTVKVDINKHGFAKREAPHFRDGFREQSAAVAFAAAATEKGQMFNIKIQCDGYTVMLDEQNSLLFMNIPDLYADVVSYGWHVTIW